MLNKIKKTINNKYYRFFRFIFFLRHLLSIFFVAITLFLIIPNFFNYEKRVEIYKSHLLKKYNFKIIKYDDIEYQALPIPRLVFKNATINIHSSPTLMNIKNLKIYPKILSIYDIKNFEVNKIKFIDNYTVLKISDFKFLNSFFFSQKNKFAFNNFNFEITDKKKNIINIKNINYSNYGYNKNLVRGKVFGNRFKIKFIDNFKHINFKLLNAGINADLNINEKKRNSINGTFKSKILNTNLRFDFNYNKKELNIYNSYLRSKYFSFKNQTLIIFDPFLNISSTFDIDDFDFKILKKIKFNDLSRFKDFLKKINSVNEINFKSKGFSFNPIDDIYLKINLAYGRVTYLKKFLFSDSIVQCEGNINLLEDFPLFYFDCKIVSDNKKKLFKEFSINTKEMNEKFKLNFKGNLNILNNKINFKNILINGNYKSSKDDLEYFKMAFEKIIFDESFFDIFDLKKIKRFILEIS